MMPRSRVDLHTHSTASDGTFSPADLVRLARDRGLSAIALTDHDTTAGFPAASEEGERLGVEVVAGVEITADASPARGQVHLLGLFVDPGEPRFARALLELQAFRAERNPRIVEKLRGLGLDVTMDEVRRVAPGGLVGRPHVARVLVEKGYAASMRDAFDRYLGDGRVAHVPKRKLGLEEAIALVRGAGGVAVLAHPSTVEPEDRLALLSRAVGAGLAGVEVQHPANGPELRATLSEFATHRGLVETGGSDFHGENKPGVELGTGRGENVHVPPEVLERVRERARADRGGRP